MKLLVFSDSHGSTNGMDAAISANPDTDAIIHCGDVLCDAEYLQQVYPQIRLFYVRGNNDFDFTVPLHLIIPLGRRKIYVTHGHIENVKNGYGGLLERCIQNHCQIGLFGHTHIPANLESGGVCLVNPGSARKTYSILLLEKEIHVINKLI